MFICIQLFRERLSEKVHVTIPNGIVGGFKFTVRQRNLKELARKAMEICLRVLKERNKSRFDNYSRQEQCIDNIPYYLSGLSRPHFFRTFLEIAVCSLQQGDKIISNCDSSVYCKVQWIVHTYCYSSFFITKCDTPYYKFLQMLQRVMIITTEEKNVST